MRQRLVEVFHRDWSDDKTPIIEHRLDETIIEAAGKSYSSVGGTYYEVPVWRLDKKNLNNRTYSSTLAKKILKENKVTVALKDHPSADEDGSVDRIVAVGKNPHIREGILYADCYFVDDPFRKKVESIIEHGGNIGLSSSGDGSVDDDGNVLEEDYSLQRYFDFVLTPSYEVYLTKEAVKNAPEPVFESTSTIIENEAKASNDKEVPPLQEEAKVRKSEERKMMTSIEEKNFKMGIESRYEKYHSAEKPSDKIKILESILEYCEGEEFAKDEYEKAKAELATVRESLIALAEKGAIVEDLEDSVQTSIHAQSELQEELEKLTNNYNTALEMLESFRMREKKLKELVDLAKAERAGMAKASELKEMLAYIESIEAEVSSLKKANRLLKKEKDLFETRFKKTITTKQRREVELAKIREEMDIDGDGDVDVETEDEDDEDQTIKVKDADVTIEDAEDVEVIQGEVEDEEDDVYDELDLRNKEEIDAYYEDVVRQNPNARLVEKQIKRCKTMFEAQRVYMALEDLINDVPKQSTNKSSLLESGKKKPVYKTQTKVREGWF